MQAKIAPSMLASNFARLESELQKCKSADFIHLDVMDGCFVPNITFGAPVIAALKKVCAVPFDVHLMIRDPLIYIEDFVRAGADLISFHFESESDPGQTVDKIIACGARPAIALKPATPAEAVLPYLDKLAMVLVMTVEPGFGGQKFMADQLEKVRTLRALRPDLDIEVDGGISPATIAQASAAGANVFVAGSAVFGSPDPAKTILELRSCAQ